MREGKVGYIAASNFTAARLSAALATSAREGLARYVALQPHYNLMVRNEYEGALSDVCAREGVACVPYFALAMGFLTGKYRPGITVDSARAEGAQKYLDARGKRVLAALDDIAAAHHTTVAAVALAWLLAQPTVAAPIASARTVAQLADLLPLATTTLTPEESTRLADSSRLGPSRSYATPKPGQNRASTYPITTSRIQITALSQNPTDIIVLRFTPYPAAIAGPAEDEGSITP